MNDPPSDQENQDQENQAPENQAPENRGHGQHGAPRGAVVTQLVIVGLLIGAMLLLHRFGVTDGRELDPTAMLALGFVVLACFTIGSLVDVIQLPHITGYLLAGMLFGPSIQGFLERFYTFWPPFDRGILNDDVIKQLSALETLAVALIALTAGGELKIESLRRGLRAISSILVVQLATVLLLVGGYFYLVSGAVPTLSLPMLGHLGAAVIPVGLTVAAISFATSPAATIAVINETGARGPMAQTVLSTVVLKDVVVVVLFGVFSALALSAMGTASSGAALGVVLSQEIFGSIAIGVLLGALISLYLRFVGKELLLFVAGVVYAASLLADEARAVHIVLDPVLIFLATGFTVANFSRGGDKFIHSVEKLSTPVYVVFFTLAGAKLHLDEVVHLFAWAAGLVIVRMVAIYIGVRVGAAVGSADSATKRYGWMGFASQAGVAITLATFVGQRFGESGEALKSLLIAGIAINEVLGPVLFKFGLRLSGEATEPEVERPESLAPQKPLPSLLPWRGSRAASDWGPPAETKSEALNRQLNDVEADLRQLVREVAAGPMQQFEEDAEQYLRELRREFLRHHRRIRVHARGVTDQESRTALEALVREAQSQLADRWRTILLARGAHVAKRAAWTHERFVTAVDDIADTTSDRIVAPYEDVSFLHRRDQNGLQRWLRRGARLRRRFAGLFGRELKRSVALRNLARFHLSGRVPPKLESVAAVLVQGQRHLAGRSRHLFDHISAGYDALAEACGDFELSLEDQAARLQQDVDEQLKLARDEIGRITKDGIGRTDRVVAQATRTLKEEASIYGTFDLPEGARRASRLFRERVVALESLGKKLDRLRDSLAGEYALLAMELELVGLEATFKVLLSKHTQRLSSELQQRMVDKVERTRDALAEALQHIDTELTTDQTTDTLAVRLRQIAEVPEKTAAEAARIGQELVDELGEEKKVAKLLEEMNATAGQVTHRYDVVVERMQRGEEKLPTPVERVNVELRELMTEHVETRMGPLVLRATRNAAEDVAPVVATLSEAERMVAFNLELVTAELDAAQEDSVSSETRKLASRNAQRKRGANSGLDGGAARACRQMAATTRDGHRVIGARGTSCVARPAAGRDRHGHEAL